MKKIKLAVTADGKKNPPLSIEVADNFLTRFCGLMLRPPLDSGHGLLLAPCNSVHMCFMRFAIDVVYIDKDYRVLKVVENLRPWLGLSMYFKAWGAIELVSGDAAQYSLRVGIGLRII